MSLNSFRLALERFTSGPVGKWTIFLIGAILVFSFVYSGLGNNLGPGRGNAAAGAQTETVATVNGDAVTRGDFDQTVGRYQQQAQQFGQAIGPLRSAALHATALDELVTAKLQLQQAKKLGLSASDAEIAKARQQAVAQYGLAEKLGLKPNASLSDIDAALAKNNQPTVEDNLPDDALRQQVLLDKLQTYEANKVAVTEQDARDSFTQYHTRHILIDNKKRSDVQAQSQAQQVLAKAQAPGADFAALAKQYSEDPGTRDKGGDDGFIDQSTGYVPEFKTAAFALKPGAVTLAKSPQYGYFVIKLDATRSNLPKDFDANKAKYIGQVKEQKQSQAMQDFVSALKNDPANKITVSDPQLRADRTVAAAATDSDPVKQQSDYRAAIADYQKALATKPNGTVAGDINVQIAQAYQALHQTPQAIAAFQAALQTTDDPDLRMALGTLYQQDKQNDKAAEQYQAASKNAWDNQTLHQQLMMAYLQMKRPDLAAQEQSWMKQYQDRQKQMQAASPLGGPGGSGGIAPPPTPTPAASASAPAASPQAVQVVPAGGQASAPGRKPVQ